MNINDFRYMWRGKPLYPLRDQEKLLLSPINIRGERHQKALLLLHGFSSSPAVYRQLLPTFTACYDAVIAPILPGHGDSIDAFMNVKAKEWMSTAEKNYQDLLNVYPKVDVLGLSLGGLLACHLSELYPINHLYLLAPALKLRMNVKRAIVLADLLHFLGFRYLRNRAGNLCSKLYGELAYRQLPITAVIEILDLVNEFKFVPPTCPTDLFLGCFDDVVDSSFVENQFITLPNCTIHWLKKSAHVLPLDHDIEVIATCVQKQTEPSKNVVT